MSIAHHHSEWLSLVEVSGPFLSVPVLERVFRQGLDAHDPDHMRSLRLAHEEWEGSRSPAIHNAWIRYVLSQTMGMPEEVAAEGQAIPQAIKATIFEHGETLRPDLVVRNPEDGPEPGKPRLLIQAYGLGQDLDRPVAGKHWKASPATRMMELLHASGMRLGLVTNGERWMLVDAPRGETTGFASWYASLWMEEPITLRAFRSLLGAYRFFGVAEKDTLEAMLAESATNQQEVTDQLGFQVRRAVEVLVQALDGADQNAGRELLRGVKETDLYEAALTVMMRLVFLFSAEERGLLLLGDPLFDQHYSLSTLRGQLRESADKLGEDVLGLRHDAWCRLLSTFRAVHGGVQHERMKLPAYAGSLFHPDKFPFLEGRKPGTNWHETPASPLPVNNRTVLHLLEALQLLQMKGEARRLSFRALDIEQIGHVYEGLLDHTAKRATEPMLGLVGRKLEEPEVALSELERLRAKRDDALAEFLKDQTGKTPNAIKKSLAVTVEGDQANRIRAVCGNDQGLWERVRPFAGLLREDDLGYPVVVHKGSVYVTEGTDRRSSGTHYTPRSLTEPIVQYTMEPLVYVGPAEGTPKAGWTLLPAAELLDLKVCDMACGSGAFLVQACRYLSERLVEAWEEAEARHPGVPGITPEGNASTGGPGEMLIPNEPEERLAYARRLVAQQCLYGVDKNPLAAEIAKLSLWLLTLAKDKPFTFLDHAIRSGDSLVGISTTNQLTTFSLNGQGTSTLGGILIKKLEALKLLREQLAHMPNNDAADVERKERMFGHVRDQTKRLTYAADLLMAASWKSMRIEEREQRLKETLFQVDYRIKDVDADELDREAREALRQEGVPAPFHWPLEFPEALLRKGRPGFDAFVGNPPFMGGTKLEPVFGRHYREYLVNTIGGGVRGVRGTADLCAYFLNQLHNLLQARGSMGVLATNTISEGDSRELGPTQLVSKGNSIVRAVKSIKWPGTANLQVSELWFYRGNWHGERYLENELVEGITPFLTRPGIASGTPHKLIINSNLCIEGSKSLGMGFILGLEEAAQLLRLDPRNADVVFPFLTGQDFNSSPNQSATRSAIYFADWPLDRASAPEGYRGKLASDYPDCLHIIEERVKPERMGYPPDSAWNRSIRDRWWQFGLPRPALTSAIEGLERVLVRSAVSNLHSVGFTTTNQVFSHAVKVFIFDDFGSFSVLQSSFHSVWLEEYASSMRTDVRYTPETCFDTFVFPANKDVAAKIGDEYHFHRIQVMLARKEGLTKTYNRFHNPDEPAIELQHLRDLHVEMDRAVATAYGWSDLDLGHGFHDTKQGLRFTLSESARREVLARLLRLNHERYAEEVKRGLHAKRKAKVVSKKKSSEPMLFD